jgi:hypothetical protein
MTTKSKAEQFHELALQFPARSREQTLILEAAQLFKRQDDAGYEFHIANLVSMQTGEGKLDVTWGGYTGQITPTKARECGGMLFEAAAAAESEAMFMRFMQDRVGVTLEKALVMLQDFRLYRREGAEPHPEDKADG